MQFDLARPTVDHIQQIAAIWQEGWHEAHAGIVPPALTALRTPVSFAARARDNLANTCVALSNGRVCGFCMVNEDELYQMYVSPVVRGTGVAAALIKDAEDRIRQTGHTVAWLACAVGNDRAMRFYNRTGWINEGRETVLLDTSEGDFPLEVWRFEKALTE